MLVVSQICIFLKSLLIFKMKNKKIRDFLRSPVVKNPPSNAGVMGLTPGWGTKIPHAVGQLSPCATTTDPVRLN